LFPKPDKLIAADVNEPAFTRRVPGTVIYARPGDWLRIHVKNADNSPHSFHVHGVRYGIDSDGSWPFGTQSDDGRRSDEICPGQSWTYTFEVTEETIGVWPFHDHWQNIGTYINRGLFGGLVVLPDKEHEHLPKFPYPPHFEENLYRVLKQLEDTPVRRRKPQRRSGECMQMTGPVSGSIASMAISAPMPMSGGGMQGAAHGLDLSDVPPEVATYLATLDELAHAPQPFASREHPLHVPLFFHQMSGLRGSPVFQSAPLNPGPLILARHTPRRHSAWLRPTITSAASTAPLCPAL
jgi:hypothetical protein